MPARLSPAPRLVAVALRIITAPKVVLRAMWKDIAMRRRRSLRGSRVQLEALSHSGGAVGQQAMAHHIAVRWRGRVFDGQRLDVDGNRHRAVRKPVLACGRLTSLRIAREAARNARAAPAKATAVKVGLSAAFVYMLDSLTCPFQVRPRSPPSSSTGANRLSGRPSSGMSDRCCRNAVASMYLSVSLGAWYPIAAFDLPPPPTIMSRTG